MLKLIKYELLGSYRQYVIIFLCFIVACVIVPFLPYNMKEIVGGFTIAAGTGITIGIFVSIILNYVKSMFKKPGYLSLTLPVDTKQLVFSKVIGALLWSMLGMVVSIIGMAIVIMSLEQASISDMIDSFTSIWRHIPYGEFVLSLLAGVAYLLVSITSVYFMATFTQTKYVPKYKTLVGIGLYVVCFLIINMILSSQRVSDIFISFSPEATISIFIVIGSIVSLLFFFGTTYLIDSKIEIE